jgi:WD40-like Beta Propeller Repeat
MLQCSVDMRAFRTLAWLAGALALAGHSAAAASGTEPGRNGLIAFTSSRGSHCDAQAIFTVRLDGKALRRLTPSSCASNVTSLAPDWSPDGKRMVYLRTPRSCLNCPPADALDVVTMRADGSGKTVVDRQAAERVKWGPDGQHLAWELPVASPGGIYIGRFGNAAERFVAAGFTPTWSPDGRSLAIAEGDEGCRRLSIFDAASGARTKVLVKPVQQTNDACLRNAEVPNWSPDGRRIAFAGTGGQLGDSADNFDIYVVRANGGKPFRVTRHRGREVHPVWSPDGRWIAYIREAGLREGRFTREDLYATRPDGTGKRRIIAHAFAPAWQRLPSR